MERRRHLEVVPDQPEPLEYIVEFVDSFDDDEDLVAKDGSSVKLRHCDTENQFGPQPDGVRLAVIFIGQQDDDITDMARYELRFAKGEHGIYKRIIEDGHPRREKYSEEDVLKLFDILKSFEPTD